MNPPRRIDETSKGTQELIAGMAKSAFHNHRLTWNADEHCWTCKPSMGNPSFHWFRLYTAYGFIVVWGDNGESCLRVSDGNALGWLLRATSMDYFLSKITASEGKEEFYPGDAKVYIDDMKSQYPILDDEGERDEENARHVAKLDKALALFLENLAEEDRDPPSCWYHAWQEAIGDGDPPDLCGPSSSALWLWQSIETFRRLHAQGSVVDGVWTPPAADGTVATGA